LKFGFSLSIDSHCLLVNRTFGKRLNVIAFAARISGNSGIIFGFYFAPVINRAEPLRADICKILADSSPPLSPKGKLLLRIKVMSSLPDWQSYFSNQQLI
jgi:hypothetical protein